MNTQRSQRKISEIAAQYERDGFAVVVEPHPSAVPFALGGYRPDLLASKGDEHHIVEVRESGTRLSVDRFQELAEEIGRHRGWRFFLVTCDDVSPDGVPASNPLLSWEDLRERSRIAPKLLELDANEAALISLWAVFEGMLRLQATRISLPIERFQTTGLLDHLYSHGELSMEQYDRAMDVLAIRNAVAHGFAAEGVGSAAAQMLDIVHALFGEWNPQSAAA
jgi:hypothetical protein